MAWTEIPSEEPKEFVRFEAIGDRFLGLFVDTSPGTYGTDYNFKGKDGKIHTIGTGGSLKAQLAAALRNGKLAPGFLVDLAFVATKQNADPTKSPMKLFKVLINDTPARTSQTATPTSDF